ncbi:hypothetical protein GX865_03765 [Candidatus Saccharibacteria bacterium]|jgi:hypothetical protein|nr:hypothetical protein [Candidatus Saccharibacteria bacterium]
MFRKLITNLSFSPSLIGEVAVYAKKLKHEEKLRRIGLTLMIPALILQIVALANPPESTNKASENDLVYGGVNNTNDLLQHYDKNELNIRDIFSALGINRAELSNLKPDKIQSHSSEQFFTVGTQLKVSHQEGGKVSTFKKHDGGTGGLYFTPLINNQTRPLTYQVLSGSSSLAGDFSIVKSSGAIIINNIPKNLSIKEPGSISLSIKAYNNTQGQENAIAKPSDRITYTIGAKNTDKEQTQKFTFVKNLSDTLEYSDVINTHGGTLDVRAQTISWPAIDMAPEEVQQRSFTVRLKSTLPATATGVSNPHSFDCVMKSNFGNTILTNVKCPPYKLAEQAASELPKVNTSTVSIFIATLSLVTLFLYLRSLQYKEEVRLIRRDVNEGVLL